MLLQLHQSAARSSPTATTAGTNKRHPSCAALWVVGRAVNHRGNGLWMALQCLNWRAFGWGANPNSERWTRWDSRPTPSCRCHTSCCPHSSVTHTKLNTLTLVRPTYSSHKRGVKTTYRKWGWGKISYFFIILHQRSVLIYPIRKAVLSYLLKSNLTEHCLILWSPFFITEE